MPRLMALRPLAVGQFHRRALSKASTSWSHSDIAAKRDKLLSEIYRPLGTVTREEAWGLLRSGQVWENHYRPASSGDERYTMLQKRCAGLLREIDELRDDMKVPVSRLAMSVAKKCSHQSVEIENGTMPYGVTLKISELLASNFANKGVELSQLSADEIGNLPLPDVSNLAGDQSSATWIIELRNNLIASEWVLEAAHRHPGSQGLIEEEVLKLATLLLRDVPVDLHQSSTNPEAASRILRRFTVYVSTNPTRIFPYPDEVPALLTRFFSWRTRVHEEGNLHPLLLACRIAVYFVCVHPFPDGNGRISRLLMHDYLVRQGYLPILFESLDRTKYLRMIMDAADNGMPEDLANSVITTQLESLKALKAKEIPAEPKA